MFRSIKKYSNLAIILTASLLLFACDSDDTVEADLATFDITLSAKSTIPQVANTVTGSGSATLTVDRNSGILTGSVTVTGLTGVVTAAHIHHGIAGSSGGLVTPLDIDNTQLSVPAGTVLSSTQISELDNSEYYINVHTAANASGEVRGQIVGLNQEVIRVELNGDNQTPLPVATSNSGVGYITVDKLSGDIRGSVQTTGFDEINTITAAHIHNAFAGTNGGLVTALDVAGSVISVPAGTTLSSDDLNTLLSGATYFNVHSDDFSNGEIRGQIVAEHITMTRDELDGTQSVPAVTTSATGIGYTTVNNDTGAISANVRTSDITATAAHVHQGSTGNTGGVVLGLIQDGTDTDFWSASGTLDNTQLTAFSNAELYFNIHSDAHASGEIRAQINP